MLLLLCSGWAPEMWANGLFASSVQAKPRNGMVHCSAEGNGGSVYCWAWGLAEGSTFIIVIFP